MNFSLYYAFLIVMLAGNVFALYNLFIAKQQLFERFPKLTDTGFTVFRLLPLANIIALAGLWFFKPWAVYLALGCGLLIIVLDMLFGIHYHLYVAIPSTLILLAFVLYNWNQFKQNG
jgi:hypothetical protein